ncbi:molybdate transport system regulatory protein [Hydrogenivirga caldilitoris]|uniref:Molybdate transport system regulatory protein n=1 Tax=Hydrogenivirga caldilitoris TaxID=246264 RepID=A0A497XQI0_9AQUI|nr:LysR family transcriptional regulator [Hydrogenivirga caldilitoris]RLJ70410.1 molybdate transport system regulatory protein [Hydrogenivirga caldilitoris]
MIIRFKVWLELDGEPIISEGKYQLLKAIEEEGSILKAAEKLGLSYKRAHSQIKAMEERLGKPVVKRRKKKGAELTKLGRKLISEYERVLKEFERLVSGLPPLKLKE